MKFNLFSTNLSNHFEENSQRVEKQSFNFFYSINAGIYSVLLIFGTEIMLALHISGMPTNIQINYILKVYN